MHYTAKNIAAIQVFFELRASRKLVGNLTRDAKGFTFTYTDSYLRDPNVFALGPEMPLYQKVYRSPVLPVPFSDRLPERKNPAYPEYCTSVGIAVDEQDPFVLLATLGHKGPSCFIFEALFVDEFSGKELLAFRKSLQLTSREFASCFDFSYAAISRTERGLASGKELLKRAMLYAHYPQVALDQIHRHGGWLHSTKRRRVEEILRKKIL